MLSFVNEGHFIVVTNDETNVKSYFNKEGLVFQGDGNTSFFLKSGDLVNYYLFSEVSAPITPNLHTLLSVFKVWVQDYINFMNNQENLIGQHTTPVLDVRTTYDKDPLNIDELATNSAISNFVGANQIDMSVTAGLNSKIIRQTKRYARIVENKLCYALISGKLISTTTSLNNVVSKIGAYDDATDVTYTGSVSCGNGVFISYQVDENGVSDMAIVYRTNITGAQVDTVAYQADWNVDRFDGTGTSLLTLDPTADNTFVFEWGALDGTNCRVGLLVNNVPIYMHRFTTVRLGCASLPLRWEIGHLSTSPTITTSTSAQMQQHQGSILVDGKYDELGVTRNADTGTALKVISTANATLDVAPIISIRLKASANRALIRPKNLTMLNPETGFAKWSLVMNPTLTGSTFNSVSDDSYVEYDTNATVAANGVVIASGFISTGITSVDLKTQGNEIMASLTGVPDILTLRLQYIRGVVTVSASIQWEELE
jgi:hypothetical protein